MSTNFTGVWNADLSRSRFLGRSPNSLTIKISHADGQFIEEIVATALDGTVQAIMFHCSIEGHADRALLNGSEVRASARWQGEHLVIESWLQAGERSMHFCDDWFLSPDGNTLFMEHRGGDLAGQITVLCRA